MNLITAIAGLYDASMLDAVAVHAAAFFLAEVITVAICIALMTADRRQPRIWSW